MYLRIWLRKSCIWKPNILDLTVNSHKSLLFGYFRIFKKYKKQTIWKVFNTVCFKFIVYIELTIFFSLKFFIYIYKSTVPCKSLFYVLLILNIYSFEFFATSYLILFSFLITKFNQTKFYGAFFLGYQTN